MKHSFNNASETPLFQPLTTDADFGTASTPPTRKNPPRRFNTEGLPTIKDRVIFWGGKYTDFGIYLDKYMLSNILDKEGYGPNDEQLRKSIDGVLSAHFHKMPIVRCYPNVGSRKTWVATYCYGWRSAQIAKDIKTMMELRAKLGDFGGLKRDIDKMFESKSSKVKRFINKALGK